MKLIVQTFIKSSAQYAVLAVAFSIIGILLPTRQTISEPLAGLSIEHILGHIGWGLMAGSASLVAGITAHRLRYCFLAGAFAILLDSDHLINFLWVQVTPRMAHSIIFGILSFFIMTYVFSKKDYVLGATALAGVLTHISYDTFTGSGKFPLLVPIQNEFFTVQTADWILFQLAAFMIIGLAAIKTRFTLIKLESKNE